MTERENQIFSDTVKIIIKYCNPEKIILFGSRAKNKNMTGSDFDFAIISENNIEDTEAIKMKNEIENIAGLYSIDIIFFNEVDNDFKQIILRTGKIVYESRT